jgi:hypothetical protein
VILQKVIFLGKITFSAKKNVGGPTFANQKKNLEPEMCPLTHFENLVRIIF